MGLLISAQDTETIREEKQRLWIEIVDRLISAIRGILIDCARLCSPSTRLLSDSIKSKREYMNVKTQRHAQQKRPRQREIRYNSQQRQLYGNSKKCVKYVTK